MPFYEVCLNATGDCRHVGIVNDQLRDIKRQWQPYGDEKRIVIYLDADNHEKAKIEANKILANLVESGDFCTGWIEFGKYLEREQQKVINIG